MATNHEKQVELERKAAEQDSQLTELNITLNGKHRRVKGLQSEKQKKEGAIIKHNEEKLVITKALQDKLEEKDAKISQYEHKLQEYQVHSGKEQKDLEREFKGEIDEKIRKQENHLNGKDATMNDLQSNLNNLNQFKDTKTIREEKLQAEEQRYYRLVTEIEKLKRNGKQEKESMKVKIMDAHKQSIRDFQAKAQTDAEKNISEIERNIQEQNTRLEDEAQIQETELEYLQLKTDMYNKDNEKNHGDLEGKLKMNQKIAVKQFEQNKKIKMLKTKIDLLETNLVQIVSDFEKERELIKFQNEQIIKEQNEELKSLGESNKLKIREGTNLKALCQMILDQRSDIEQFFLESLEQVKEEKRRKLEQERNAQLQIEQQRKNRGLPQGLMSDVLSQNQLTKITVELSDLDWEDRERILRLLFSKMNTGQSAPNWRDNENPSQSQQEAGSSHNATGKNQSFREQEEEDYGDEDDAQIFNQTNIPEDQQYSGSNRDRNNQYYDEEGQSNSQYGRE